MDESKRLVVLHLRYSSGTRPLRVRALAELAEKALFNANRALTSKETSEEASRLLGVPRVSSKLLLLGLQDLEASKRANRSPNAKWSLTGASKKTIKRELAEFNSALEKVVERHFPAALPRDKACGWFVEQAAASFGHHGDEWVSIVAKGQASAMTNDRISVESTVETAKRYSLEGYESALVEGFRAFLNSQDRADQEFFMSLGFASFHSALVAANISADPLTLPHLKNATFVLDTNTLLAISLQGKVAKQALDALGSAFKTIGAKLVFLHETREEYKKTVSAHRQEVVTLAEKMPLGLLQATGDDFITTGIARGCKSSEDFARFFSTLKTPPSHIGSSSISLLDDEKLKELAENAKTDKKLIQRLKATSAKMKGRPKRDAPAAHDSGLIQAVDALHSDSVTWGVTLDSVVLAVTRDLATPREPGRFLTLDSLVELLAVENAGPNIDPVHYAPLLGQVLQNRLGPRMSSFRAVDLMSVVKANERAAELPSEEIARMAARVAKLRTEGKDPESSEVQMEVNRTMEVTKQRLDEEVVNNRKRIQQSEERIDALKKEKTTEHQIRIQVQAKYDFIKQCAVRFVVIVGGTLVFLLVRTFLPADKQWDIWITFLPSIAGFFVWINKPYGVLKLALKKARPRPPE